jgi:hypothetical protein
MAELRARVHNILEVRLLHVDLRETVRELEASREVIRLKTLAENEKSEWESGLAQRTQEASCPVRCRSLRISVSAPTTAPLGMWEAIFTISCL